MTQKGPEGVPAGARTVLVVVFITTIMMSLSSNMLNIAIPAITRHFEAGASQASLVVVAYQLVNTALLIPAGQIADALDRRRVFLVGLAVFALTSLLIGFAPSMTWVAIGRALQGASSALLLSNAVAILAAVFPPGRLAGAMGVYLSGFSLGQVAGPLVGGVLVSAVGWQWLFWGLAPMAGVALVGGLVALRIVPREEPRRPQVDVPGGLLLAVILAGSQLVLSLSARVGLGDARILTGLSFCLLLVPVLVLVERRLKRPVLDPVLFRNRDFSRGLTEGFLIMLPRLGAITIAGLYFQGIHGDSAATAALKVMAFPAALTLGSLLGDRVGRLFGVPRSLGAAAVVAAAGMALLVASIPGDASWLTMVGLGVLGLGNGVFQTLNSTIIMSTAPAGRAGVVNAIRVMFQSFGTGLGLALAMALIVALAPAQVAQVFLAGQAAGDAAAREVIDHGYLLAYGVFAVLMAIGAVLTVRHARDLARP